MPLQKAVIVLIAFTAFCSRGFSQRYNFISYNTEEGLPQSQVFGLEQSTDRQIWMSTYGGISRFDGATFHNYTTSEGLAANYTIHFVLDHYQRVWAVTNASLNLIEGNKVRTFPLPQIVKNYRARLAVTDDNILWCLINGTLYSFRNDKFIKATVDGFPTHSFFALLKGEGRSIYMMAPERTLYKYSAGSWRRFLKIQLPDSITRVNHVYPENNGNVYVLTNRELLMKRSGLDNYESVFATTDKSTVFYCVAKDKVGNFWLGANNSAYLVKPDKSFVHFNNTNGFANNSVNDIMVDAEGNTWLGTNGDGLLKYGGGVFTSFKIDADINNMQNVAGDSQGNLLYGNTGQDLCRYNGVTKDFFLRNTSLRNADFSCVFDDGTGTIWLGVPGKGLWKYRNGKVEPTAMSRSTVYSASRNGDKIVFSSGEGLIIVSNDTMVWNTTVREFTGCTIGAGKDSLLVSTQYGVVLLRDTTRLSYPFPADIQKTTVTAFEKIGNKIFMGTVGGGLFIWDKRTGSFDRITISNGLGSNIVYSLKFDNKGQLWAGTGRGISRLGSEDGYNTVTVRNYGRVQGLTGMECNSNEIAVMHDNTVWFGTSRGLYCYHPEEDRGSFAMPVLTLQSVKLFSKPLLDEKHSDTTVVSALESLPLSPVLSHEQNHITFEFRAMTYSYNSIRYSYFLQGLENNFSAPDATNFVVYPSLPPGDYVFNVKAFDEMGRQLGGLVKYPFYIKPAFYQTTWFRLLLLVAAIGIGLLIYTIRKRSLSQQKKLIEQLRDEEQRKIRKKTAQDFHDEMGNKLARITVLSEMLKVKLPANEESQGLAKKIQENAAWLYQGTKDIIWSLNPDNDNLGFLLKYIGNIGVDLFLDTDIEFEAAPVNDAFDRHCLTMDYARNVIMICKEAFTNILKHSKCSRVTMEATMIETNKVRLSITDNGKGFNPLVQGNGNGLTNIRQRANSLDATMRLQSAPGEGTALVFIFTLPEVE